MDFTQIYPIYIRFIDTVIFPFVLFLMCYLVFSFVYVLFMQEYWYIDRHVK